MGLYVHPSFSNNCIVINVHVLYLDLVDKRNKRLQFRRFLLSWRLVETVATLCEFILNIHYRHLADNNNKFKNIST